MKKLIVLFMSIMLLPIVYSTDYHCLFFGDPYENCYNNYLKWLPEYYIPESNVIQDAQMGFLINKTKHFTTSEMKLNVHIKDKLQIFDKSEKVTNFKIYKEAIIEKNVTIGYNNVTFNVCNPNKTKCRKETRVSYESPITRIKNVTKLIKVTTKEISDFIKYAPIGENIKIVFKGKVEPGLTVDVIPEIFNYNYTEYAWWTGMGAVEKNVNCFDALDVDTSDAYWYRVNTWNQANGWCWLKTGAAQDNILVSNVTYGASSDWGLEITMKQQNPNSPYSAFGWHDDTTRNSGSNVGYFDGAVRLSGGMQYVDEDPYSVTQVNTVFVNDVVMQWFFHIKGAGLGIEVYNRTCNSEFDCSGDWELFINSSNGADGAGRIAFLGEYQAATIMNFSNMTLYNLSGIPITDPSSNIIINSSNVRYGDWLNITLNASDNHGLSHCWFYSTHNNSNSSPVDLSGTADTCTYLMQNNLTRGQDLNITGYVNNTNALLNYSKINITITNTLPTHGTPILNSTNILLNDTLQNLTLYNVSSVEVDGDSVYNTIRWYNNTNLVLAYNETSPAPYILNYNMTNIGDIWVGEITICDEIGCGAALNSSNMTILNSVPSITVINPTNNTYTTSTVLNVNLTGSDSDNEDLTFYTYIKDNLNSTGNFTLTGLPDFAYNITFKVTDGNSNNSVSNYLYTIDTINVNVTILSNNGFLIDNTSRIHNKNNTVLEINVSFYDINLNHTSLNITQTGNFIYYNQSNATTYYYNYTDNVKINNWSYGTYYAYFNGNDKAGNEVSKPYSFILYNNPPPEVLIYSPVLNESYNNNDLINISYNLSKITDVDGNPVRTSIYLIKNSDIVANISVNVSNSVGFNTVLWNSSNMTYGTYNVNVTLCDTTDYTLCNSSRSNNFIISSQSSYNNTIELLTVLGNVTSLNRNQSLYNSITLEKISFYLTNMYNNVTNYTDITANPAYIIQGNLAENYTGVNGKDHIFDSDKNTFYGALITTSAGDSTIYVNLSMNLSVPYWTGTFDIGTKISAVVDQSGNPLFQELSIYNYNKSEYENLSRALNVDSHVISDIHFETDYPSNYTKDDKILLLWDCRVKDTQAAGDSKCKFADNEIFNFTYSTETYGMVGNTNNKYDISVDINNDKIIDCASNNTNITGFNCTPNYKLICNPSNLNCTFTYNVTINESQNNLIGKLSYVPYINSYNNFRVVETSLQSIDISISKFGATGNDMVLYYNGTKYTYDRNIYDGFNSYNYSIYIPKHSVHTNYTHIYYFNYNHSYLDRVEDRTSYTYNQTVWNLVIDNCTINTMKMLNVTLYNQDDQQVIGNISYAFNYWNNNSDYNLNYSNIRMNSNLSLCIFPNWSSAISDVLFDYNYGGDYYAYSIYQNSYSNASKKINLYVDSGTTQVLFTVLDTNSDPIENAYIHVLKYDTSENSYKVTEILKTDSQGQSLGNIVLGTAYYNFLIYLNGNLVYTEQGVKLIATTRTFTVDLAGTNYIESFNTALDVDGNVVFNNNTLYFTFTYSDSNNEIDAACLKVQLQNMSGSFTVSDNCQNAYSGTIVYNVGSLINGTTYTGIGYVKNPEIFTLDTAVYYVDPNYSIFNMSPLVGVFLGFMVTLTLFLIGIPHPVISLLFLGVGVILSSMLGLFAISLMQVSTIIILVLIKIYYKKQY